MLLAVAAASLLLAIGLTDAALRPEADGPCNQQKSSRHPLRCTPSGYFSLIQCDQTSCFCVSPPTGTIAYDTKTRSNATQPSCGACLVQQERTLLSGGVVSALAKCEPRRGDYEKVQCSRAECWCVEPQTGREIADTRGPSSSSFDCRVTKQSDNLGEPVDYPVANPFCKLPLDLGTFDKSCANATAPQTQYYFDYSLFECLAFEHRGCGGNLNRFPTKSACVAACKMVDLGGCSGQRAPVPNSSQCGSQNWDVCPPGSKCVMGAFFGLCCDSKIEATFLRNYRPVCPGGTPVKDPRVTDWEEPLLGRKCSHRFCPAGSTCREGEVFAHCCPN